MNPTQASSIKLAADSDSLYRNTLIGRSPKNAAQHIQLQGTAHKRSVTSFHVRSHYIIVTVSVFHCKIR